MCLWHLSQRNGNYVYVKTYTWTFIVALFKSHELETNQIFINMRMSKQTVAYLCYEILLGNKKETTIATHNLGRSQGNYTERQKLLPTVSFHLYNIFEMAKL